MNPATREVTLRAMQEALERELPESTWALDEYVDNTPCLVLGETAWVGGFFERGSFDVRFRTESFNDAAAWFTNWVRSVDESTRLSAEATARWLERTGRKRPNVE